MGRGQVALEFLVTYGWALVAIMGVLGVLGYLGVFNLDLFVVERCDFYSNIYCIDGRALPTGVSLVIQNGLAIDMSNISVHVENCGVANGSSLLISGEQGQYDATCVLSQGEVFKSVLTFNYTNPDSGLYHTKVGRLLYKVP